MTLPTPATDSTTSPYAPPTAATFGSREATGAGSAILLGGIALLLRRRYRKAVTRRDQRIRDEVAASKGRRYDVEDAPPVTDQTTIIPTTSKDAA